MTISSSAPVDTRPASTGDRLVSAALEAFSTTGFEGTSARQIERLAGVERGLVGYHFGSKQELWNRAVDLLFDRYTDELESLRHALRDVSKRERASAMLMAYARFNARNPEFFRILIIEGHTKSERSERLALHLRRAMTVFSDLTEMSEAIPVQTAVRWFQVIGAAGALYSLSVHAEQTFGDMLHQQGFIDQFAASLTAIAMDESAHVTGHSDDEVDRVHFVGGQPPAHNGPTLHTPSAD
jgi:AcrR family transcriptional regulator